MGSAKRGVHEEVVRSDRSVVEVSPWKYTLYRDAEGRLFLSVLVGGVGLHGADILLTPKERDAYSSLGSRFLDQLANEVAKG